MFLNRNVIHSQTGTKQNVAEHPEKQQIGSLDTAAIPGEGRCNRLADYHQDPGARRIHLQRMLQGIKDVNSCFTIKTP